MGGLVSCGPAPGGGGKAKAGGPEPVPITVAKVSIRPLDRSITVVGTLTPKDEAILGAEVDGQLEKVMAEFGDRLSANQDMAYIDRSTYEAQLLQAEASLARARACEANAAREHARTLELSKQSIASASALDQAVSTLEMARAEAKAAEASIAVAKLRLTNSVVQAPYACAVAERLASQGDYLKVGMPIFRVVNDAELKFIFQVTERYAALVKSGQETRLEVDAWPGLTFSGRVYLIGPSVNLTPRSFSVGALVPNQERKLRAGTFARAQLVLEAASPTVVVPLDSVVSFVGVTKVFVLDGKVVRSREIKPGRVKDGLQEIQSGLKDGETVVVTGQARLYDGAPVRVKDAEVKAEK
jgi:RND family efflux transporter MFP subunit